MTTATTVDVVYTSLSLRRKKKGPFSAPSSALESAPLGATGSGKAQRGALWCIFHAMVGFSFGRPIWCVVCSCQNLNPCFIVSANLHGTTSCSIFCCKFQSLHTIYIWPNLSLLVLVQCRSSVLVVVVGSRGSALTTTAVCNDLIKKFWRVCIHFQSCSLDDFRVMSNFRSVLRHFCVPCSTYPLFKSCSEDAIAYLET